MCSMPVFHEEFPISSKSYLKKADRYSSIIHQHIIPYKKIPVTNSDFLCARTSWCTDHNQGEYQNLCSSFWKVTYTSTT